MDAYKIGVHLSMTNGVSPVLGVIAQDLMGVDTKVKETEAGFGRWKTAIIGIGAIMAGGAILGAMGDLVHHGEELVHVQATMNTAGMTGAEIAQATAESWKLSAMYGLKVSQVAQDMKELRMVFGSTGHAIEFADPLERMRVVLNAVKEGKGNDAADAVFQMARAGELKGLIKPEDFVDYFDKMTKAISASGGKIDPLDFMSVTKYGRIGAKGWNEDFYTRELPSMMMELGPSTAGTALMSLFQSFVQGKITAPAVQALRAEGLIADESKVNPKDKGFRAGAIKDSDLLIRNPYEWAQQILKPAVERKLGRAIAPGDEDAITELGAMLGNRTAGAAAATLLLEGPRIDKDAALIDKAQGLNGADDLLKNDPTTAMNNFKASWDNLLTALGSPLVPSVVGMMNGIADAVKSVTAFAVANPETMKVIGAVLLGLAAGLVAIGLALVGGAIALAIGAGGWLIIGIVAIGTAIAGLVAAYWPELIGFLGRLGDAIALMAKLGWSAIVSGVQSLITALNSLIDWVAGVAGRVNGLFPHLVGYEAPDSTKVGGQLNALYPGGYAPGMSVANPADSASAPKGYPSITVPPAAPPNVTVNTTVKIDGQDVKKSVVNQIVRDNSSPSSAAGFDGRQTYSPPDMIPVY
jgi:hypothetical protein